jgi:putative peptidoglycan lipid II flippase
LSKSFAVILSSLKMAIATFMSRILGLVREQVMAAMFGASGFTDAYLVAFRIPNLLRDLFAEGAFSSAFVPTFVEANNEDHEKGRQLLWSLFVILLLLTGVFSLLIFFFAPELIGVFAPSFKADPEKFEITVNLTKIMAPFLVFVSLAALFMGALNSLKVFFIPALAPAFFNIVMILSMLVFPAYFINEGVPAIYSLGVGVFIGGLVQGLFQFPFLIKKGYGPLIPASILFDRSKKVIKLLGPGLIGFAATQVNLLVTTILASGAAVGAVSWLSYSFRLFQLPVGILSVSIGNSNLVHFSTSWKNGEHEKAKGYLSSSYFLNYLMVLPAMVVLLMLSEEIINVIFERGKFTHDSTLMTAKALKWYAVGLPFYSIYKTLVPTFYSIDRQKVPVYTSIFCVAINIVFCVMLVPHYGFEVLALGTSLSMLLNSSIQTWIVKGDLQMSLREFFNMRWAKLLLAAALSAASVYGLKLQLNFFEYNFIQRCLILAIEIGLVALSYFVMVYLLGERSAVQIVIDKLRQKRS